MSLPVTLCWTAIGVLVSSIFRKRNSQDISKLAAAHAPAVAPIAVHVTEHGQRSKVQCGVDVLCADNWRALHGRKVGLVTNQTGVLASLQHTVDAMHASKSTVNVVAVFGPEHGFRGSAQAGSSEGASTDPATGLPVYDLYRVRGAALRQLFQRAGVDTLVYDIQDVGARYYTYIWLLYDCLEAAAQEGSGLWVVVLDRPNPVGGVLVEGPVLHPEFASDVGRQPIALRHGMTIGELARLFNAEFVPATAGRPCELQVVRMEGWRRHMLWAGTGLPWVPPSPNMPTGEAALVYCGMGLVEGTLASEGRGTCTPFLLVGAPALAPHRLRDSAQAWVRKGQVRGCVFREAVFTPMFSKHAGAPCGGVFCHVTAAESFEGVRAALAVLLALRAHGGLTWRAPQGGAAFADLLAGCSTLREGVDRGMGVDELVALWQEELSWFKAVRSKYLMY